MWVGFQTECESSASWSIVELFFTVQNWVSPDKILSIYRRAIRFKFDFVERYLDSNHSNVCWASHICWLTFSDMHVVQCRDSCKSLFQLFHIVCTFEWFRSIWWTHTWIALHSVSTVKQIFGTYKINKMKTTFSTEIDQHCHRFEHHLIKWWNISMVDNRKKKLI